MKKISLIEGKREREIFGNSDEHLKLIEKKFDVRISGWGQELSISGNSGGVSSAKNLISQLDKVIADGFTMKSDDLKLIIRLFEDDPNVDIREIFSKKNRIHTGKRSVIPRGIIQNEYVQAIKSYDLVFGIGPAGTGKTYLAMAMAISSLLKKKVGKIILTRPAVEAGEKLGFLPGDLYEKVNPFLRPLYDALYDMTESEKSFNMIENGIIEIAPLAFMRGRTLNDSFIILDEAQNCTSEQMKMFLTRLGFNSKAVVTGDVTQIDLPRSMTSGLIEARNILKGAEEIKFVFFNEKDVVRHSLVRTIIQAYDKKSLSHSTGSTTQQNSPKEEK